MPLIKVEKETEKISKKIVIERELMENINLYAKLLGKEPENNEVINLIFNEGMKFFLGKDKDFIEYKNKLELERHKQVNNNESSDENDDQP